MVIEINAGNVRQIIDFTDTFLLDCDGVLWLNKNVIPGVPDTLAWLRSIVCTSNCTKSRVDYEKVMRDMQIQAASEEIWCTSYAAALYLHSLNFKNHVYIIGADGIAKELDLLKILHNDIHNHCEAIESISDVCNYELDLSVRAVIVGMDLKFNYRKLCYALLHLRNRPDCLFIATNDDQCFPTTCNLISGTGAIVKAVECCSGRNAFVVGKPSKWLLEQIISKHNLDVSRTVMIGDKLTTDIAFGNSANIRTLLVLTGVTNREILHSTETGSKSETHLLPNFFVTSLPALKTYYQA